MPTENVYAESARLGDVSNPNNALGVADGTYTTDTGNTSWSQAWDLTAPSGSPDGGAIQTLVVRVRKQTGSGNPSYTVSVQWDLGGGSTSGQGVGSGSVTSSTGQDLTFQFVLNDLSGYSSRINDKMIVYIQTTAAGGGPSARAAVQVDAMNWQAVTAGGGGGASGTFSASLAPVTSSASGVRASDSVGILFA